MNYFYKDLIPSTEPFRKCRRKKIRENELLRNLAKSAPCVGKHERQDLQLNFPYTHKIKNKQQKLQFYFHSLNKFLLSQSL